MTKQVVDDLRVRVLFKLYELPSQVYLAILRPYASGKNFFFPHILRSFQWAIFLPFSR
jgi:hypothetical protein